LDEIQSEQGILSMMKHNNEESVTDWNSKKFPHSLQIQSEVLQIIFSMMKHNNFMMKILSSI